MIQHMDAAVVWKGGMKFEGGGHYPRPIAIDYSSTLEQADGHLPLELLLVSLASCTGGTVIALLQKMRQDVRAFSVAASGDRRTEHPTVFTNIQLTLTVTGKDVDPAMVEKAIKLSEEKYCPVWVMLRGSVRIAATFSIVPVP